MREAPLGHDRAAARHDAGHALRGQRNVAQQHAGVDREVVDALLGLLDQRVAVDLPRQVLGLAVDFLERLVDRHGADRHRRIAHDPFARLVDVLAGRQVHHRVAAPADRPRHLLHFLADRRRHGGVADVGVDLHEEIAADDHRLRFGMVDVVRDDRAAARHFVAHEFGRDHVRDRGAEALARMLAAHAFGQLRDQRLAQLVLADRDELHLRRDDAAARVVHLRDIGAGLRAARLAVQVEAQARELGIGEARLAERRRRPGELDGVAAFGDPRGPQRRQSLADVDRRGRIGVRPGRVVDGQRRILFRAERGGRVALRDLAHRHAQVGPRTFDVDLAGGGQRRDGGRIHLRVAREELVVGIHGDSPRGRRREERKGDDTSRFPAPALSGSGSKGLFSPGPPMLRGQDP